MKRVMIGIGLLIALVALTGCPNLFGTPPETVVHTVTAADSEWTNNHYAIFFSDTQLDGESNVYFAELKPDGFDFWVELTSYGVPSGGPIYFVGVTYQTFGCFAPVDLIGATIRLTPYPR